ncbi:GNAT family N-acetyltransferase [Spirillospora albida]|uniref:GNAT family N-acetyltransferase n=1 Tax=Spirillospora albida TaxID=58123 RepID=UPI00068ED7A8|nr:GNAT family N-acetyltransferase [Spirillospora albida]
MSEVLRTGRLELHPVGWSDHGPLLAHWTGPLVRRHLFDDRMISPAQVTEIIEVSERDFATEGYGLWALRPAGPDPAPAGPLIGVAGLRGHDGPLDRRVDVEIVYSLEPDRWGRGYAEEACRAVLDYAFEVVGLTRVTAEIDCDNASSADVAERLGMRPWRDGPDGPDGAAYYQADRTMWFGSRRTVDAFQ